MVYDATAGLVKLLLLFGETRCRAGGRVLRLLSSCALPALLAACAASGPQTGNFTTQYYIEHAAGNYVPPGPASDPWGPYINIASEHFDVPAPWIRKVMRIESGGKQYHAGQLTVSAAGAMGLMQLEPGTYREMAARYGLGADPFNPYDNIMAGTAYIHEMYEVYGTPGFLAAYDAGPGRLDSYMNDHRPLPYETVNYVAMIAPSIQGYYPRHRSEADQLAMNNLPAGDAPGILPAGFSPDRPTPGSPYAPAGRTEVAVLSRPPSDDTSVYVPPPEASALAQNVPATPKHSFAIISSAMADTPPVQTLARHSAHDHDGWAIQLGAYDSSADAHAALGLAELSAVRNLVNGHPRVVASRHNGRIKYKARFVGLPRYDAVEACDRLISSPSGCIVLSPEVQS
jgi:hypothetical protein